MTRIDMAHWDRKEHFAYFRQLDYPQYNICANVDITRLLAAAKANSLQFYYAMIFAVTATANGLPNFRYRIRDNEVWLCDRLHPSFTHMDKETGLFKYVTVDMGDKLTAFVQLAAEKAEQQKGLFGNETDEAREDLLYLTCLPWVSFTGLTHPIALNKDDAIPRISWGKYFTENGKTQLPLSVQVHHALADGYHVGQFFTGLQTYLDEARL
jgi:chloramphenicol O-acetyltransferase type A